MTRKGILEYVEAIRERYRRASKEEKGKILDEFTQTTHLHRKAAIRLMNRISGSTGKGGRGRPRRYGAAVADALKGIWEAADRLCSKRLHPFIPELLHILKRHEETTSITLEIERQLYKMSPATIDRLLRPWRRPPLSIDH